MELTHFYRTVPRIASAYMSRGYERKSPPNEITRAVSKEMHSHLIVISNSRYSKKGIRLALHRLPLETHINARSPDRSSQSGLQNKKRQLPTLPHCIAVPSAQSGLTSLFGMGRGGTPTQ